MGALTRSTTRLASLYRVHSLSRVEDSPGGGGDGAASGLAPLVGDEWQLCGEDAPPFLSSLPLACQLLLAPSVQGLGALGRRPNGLGLAAPRVALLGGDAG